MSFQTHRTIESWEFMRLPTTSAPLVFVQNQFIMLNVTGESFVIQFPTVSSCGTSWLETWLVMER